MSARKWILIAGSAAFIGAGISTNGAPVDAVNPAELDAVALNRELALSWMEMLDDKRLSDVDHHRIADQLYGLIFLFWFTSEYQGKPCPYLDRHHAIIWVDKLGPYLDIKDPFQLLKNYDALGRLDENGRLRVGSLPLLLGKQAFDKKQNYEKLVAAFLAWSRPPK